MDLFLRTLPSISDILQPLETTILKEFIPAIAGKSISDLERDLFSLPVRMGGLGLCDPSSIADFEFEASVSITSPLIQEIIQLIIQLIDIQVAMMARSAFTDGFLPML